MAFYFEVRADCFANFSGDWSLIQHYHYGRYDLYRSIRYETISDMQKDVRAFMDREKPSAIPILLENGSLLPDSDLILDVLMDDDLPCGCPSIEACERGGCV